MFCGTALNFDHTPRGGFLAANSCDLLSLTSPLCNGGLPEAGGPLEMDDSNSTFLEPKIRR